RTEALAGAGKSKSRAWKFLLLLPVLLFCALSLTAILRAREGSWHSRCTEFWEKREYQQLVNLASNLDELGIADAEILYFASRAAEQIHDSSAVLDFSARLHARPVLNWTWEKNTSPPQHPQSMREFLACFRTRMIAATFALLMAFNVLVAIGKRS